MACLQWTNYCERQMGREDFLKWCFLCFLPFRGA